METEVPQNKTKKLNNVPEKTVGLILNLLTNLFIMLTVFVCILYSCKTWKLGVFEMHILFCVIGYQFFMYQGTLVFSKFNWSMFLSYQQKRNIHWAFQIIGCVFVATGSILMMKEKHLNFDTAHGITGMCALISSLLGILNGTLAMYAYKLSSYLNIRYIKYLHSITGIGTLFFSAMSLCLGFDKKSFRAWSSDDNVIFLIIVTCVFTLLIPLDYWLAFSKRIFRF